MLDVTIFRKTGFFSKILPNNTHKIALAVHTKKYFPQNPPIALSFIETVPLHQVNEIYLRFYLSIIEAN